MELMEVAQVGPSHGLTILLAKVVGINIPIGAEKITYDLKLPFHGEMRRKVEESRLYEVGTAVEKACDNMKAALEVEETNELPDDLKGNESP